MGIYGVDFYGTTKYGAPLYLAFDARPFTAEPVGYGALRLTWVNPKLDWVWNVDGPGDGGWIPGPEGEWSRLRIVRSSYGFPIFPEDGVTIFEQQAGDNVSTFVDEDVKGGRFVYYSIFALEVANDRWIRAGDTIGLPTEDHRYGGSLLNLMPQFLREADAERSRRGEGGPLESYMEVIGSSLNHVRTEYETLRWLRNPEQISGNLIRPLAQMFGVPFEPAIGMRQARVWLRDAVYLYRIKGTRPGVEAAASAMTGWGARVTYGPNLLRAEGPAGWFSLGSMTQTFSPDDPTIPAMRVEHNAFSTAIKTSPFSYGTTADVPTWYSTRIQALTDYSLSAQLRPAPDGGSPGREYSWVLTWYGPSGDFMGSTTSPSQTLNADGWVTLSFTANSPAGAAYAAVRLASSGAVAPTPMLIRRIQLEQGSAPSTWTPARAIVINFDPVRWNFIPNPAFTNGLFSWSLDTGDYSLGSSPVGPASGNQNAILDGKMSSGPMGVASSSVSHVFSAYVRGTGQVSVQLDYFTNPGDEDPVASFTETHDVGGEGRVWVAGPNPFGSLFARVSLTTSQSMDVGSTMLEEGSVPGDYFDGNFFGADYLWASAPGVSASKYYPNRTERNVRVRDLIVDYLPIGQPFLINYIGGAPSTGRIITGDEGTTGVGTYGIMPFGQ